MLTPSQLIQAKATSAPAQGASSGAGMTPEQAQSWTSAPAAPVSQPSAISKYLGGYLNGIKQNVVSNVNEAGQDLNDSQSGKTNPFAAGASIAQHASSALISPVTEAFKPVAEKAVHVAQPLIDAVANKVGDQKVVQDFTALLDKHPTLTKSLSDLAGTGLNMLGVEGGIKTGQGAIDNAPETIAKVKDVMNTGINNASETIKDLGAKTPQQVDSTILDSYKKAIKPSVAGKNNAGQIANSDKNITSAVRTIAENKNNLSFTNELGEESTGRTPESPKELSQAIDQTKSAIFDKYNALAEKAGQSGIKVDSAPLANELDKLINNQAIKIANPQAIEYAKNLQARFAEDAGGYKQFDPKVTQDIIKSFNESLDAFYKNPSYDTASKGPLMREL